ncbi:nucleolar complex protein 1 [Chironomus tepperi]|uniref:nucleolar complex protein 1 n=1 Tax=Chironomus tepperi TaxID=113505 RepID=UPI00391F70F2
MIKNKEPLKITTEKTNKKIFFGENGEIVDKPIETKDEKQEKIKKSKKYDGHDIGKKWYQLYDEYNTKELMEIKESEFKTFEEHCKKCFTEEVEKLQKKNPSDAKWLQTALQKGTSKDRANAGALLVQSNPLPNLSSLDLLITLTKFSNKNSSDILEPVTNLFKFLLPSHRKLVPLDQRGNDWKNLKKMTIDQATRNDIYAHWYFENELKGRYNTYLQHLQGSLQNGKEINKIKAIISASNLLKTCPEREAYLLTILVNKFGDPDKKIASKCTYNLRQILLSHPNMAHVMILETEKLIFRKNINDLAQHYGIGFLSLIAPIANAQSSQKLINICFCFFKIKIEKGDINSKTMQAILNCLRIAIQNINEFNEEKKKMEITTPEVVNQIYRLIYLSNISISFQALSLLLQLVLVQNENHDRFYNALYRKMIDPEIFNASNKITSLYFHIIHRSIHQDSNVSRCKAFIKRLLQMTLSLNPAKACGALIVISKLLKTRPELKSFYLKTVAVKDETPSDKVAKKIEEMDSDEEEQYKDVEIDGKVIEHDTEKVKSSWIHVKNSTKQKEETIKQIKNPTKYDPFKRSAAYSGAEFTLYYELILMSKFFHPTVQVFVENVMKSQKINYFGDPLKDFSLSHFLERFAFKNPKKVDPKEEKSAFHHTYQPKGSRGQSVYTLTDQTCTEDERFIFDFIQRKREIKEKNVQLSAEDEEASDVESVNDDEFDSYLDTLGAKADFDKSEEDFDYLSEIQNESSKKEVKGKKKSKEADDEEDDMDDNWEDDDDDDEDGSEMDSANDTDLEDDESGTDQSIDEEMDGSDLSDGSDEEMEEKPAKSSKKVSKNKSKKEEKGMNNLFVAVDDFSEMIEKNSSKHGTLGEIFNKDKSSQAQLDWEEKRHNTAGGYKRKNSFGKAKFPIKRRK